MILPTILPYHGSLFCRVIDNYGDIGVCLRLAKQLAIEYMVPIDFWVDDLVTFKHVTQYEHLPAHVRIIHWHTQQTHQPPPAEHQIMIEGFACRAPTHLTQHAKDHSTKNAEYWINLEYLSAESWSIQWHLSPMPYTHAVQHAWFPGFDLTSGGLLREANLIQQQKAFLDSPTHINLFWQRLCLPKTHADFRQIVFVFSYNNGQLDALFTACNQQTKTLVLLADHYVQNQYQQWLEQNTPMCSFYPLPFVSSDDFDRLLWLSHLNIVRGEDSLVRAIWAGKALLWHIYPQPQATHLNKLNAFTMWWHDQTDSDNTDTWLQTMHGLNTPETVDWHGVLQCTHAWQQQTRTIREQLLTQPDLASRLIHFIDAHTEHTDE